MTKFGNDRSWTQLFKISYRNLQADNKFDELFHRRLLMFPLYFSENGDMLVLASKHETKQLSII